jgi:ribosomal-protein-alanine N-acetyltransferase
MSAELRPLARADADAVLRLVAEIEAGGGVDAGFYWPQKDLQEEIWITEGWGAFSQGRLQAFALYREAGPIWEITVLATALKARRQGWMEKLLQAVVNAKGQQGEIWLEVHEKNQQAQKLYEKLGFRAVGERPRYYRDGARAVLYSHSGEAR